MTVPLRDRPRIVVTGHEGQLARALKERAAGQAEVELLTVGRPELDLARPDSIYPVLAGLRPDLVVNAAAYTAVDLAESEPELAMAINGEGAGAVAAAANRLRAPVIQISTDYVFSGDLGRAYAETDTVGPLSAYGRSKRAGELAALTRNADSVVLRTAWAYSPFGRNFAKTMLKLAEDRDQVSVVADQFGAPTSAMDLADGVLAVARNLLARPDDRELRGVFHMTAAGRASWAEFAEAIFQASQAAGGPYATVKPITTADYPTPARRPANSQLDCAKLLRLHGVALPDWRRSAAMVVERLVAEGRKTAGERT